MYLLVLHKRPDCCTESLCNNKLLQWKKVLPVVLYSKNIAKCISRLLHDNVFGMILNILKHEQCITGCSVAIEGRFQWAGLSAPQTTCGHCTRSALHQCNDCAAQRVDWGVKRRRRAVCACLRSHELVRMLQRWDGHTNTIGHSKCYKLELNTL